MSSTPYVGALTAYNNSPVAMTVSDVIRSEETGEITSVACQYFVGAILQHAYGSLDAFIGFGDSLIFEGGAFHEAFNNRIDDAEEEEEEEEELEPEDTDPTA
jgi:hypothetical protein|uniref:Uncharacterized protein n=1 Tax=Myoviridae sp. ctshb19 TaxID=2825194 RepID=A0A8S5UH00_9CAUD|nr:MAG TPA: hypothetical protein [Myoviridae sp. ctshb19]